ncbi:MAG: sulfurtransferase TusA family protein [Francisellaceae bacterium]|jgi:tRNA 2-thiouridine synthesizing protein A|nr:sulfurtransferase TusA family protein [Francisellaceae bacterium]MBT6538117.1 sulfurtransferase TusA family protein [Francisellaceae bacterium]
MFHENTEKLDLVGLKCPHPIMHTQKKMRDLNNGDKLIVQVSDPSFNIDLGVYIRQSGHMLLNSWQEKETNCFLLECR